MCFAVWEVEAKGWGSLVVLSFPLLLLFFRPKVSTVFSGISGCSSV